MLRKKRQQEEDYIADINVTPFIDVLLVLLIMFMVVAATPLSKINVKLPDGKNNTKITTPKEDKIVITINKDKSLYFLDQKTNIDEILKKLSLYQDKEKVIYINADKALEYGLVMSVINNIKSSNFRNISLITYQ
jgi:biopolymer transport protein ExbD